MKIKPADESLKIKTKHARLSEGFEPIKSHPIIWVAAPTSSGVITMKLISKNILEAVCWFFGMNKKEAREYIRNADNLTLQAIAEGYTTNCKREFYND